MGDSGSGGLDVEREVETDDVIIRVPADIQAVSRDQFVLTPMEGMEREGVADVGGVEAAHVRDCTVRWQM